MDFGDMFASSNSSTEPPNFDIGFWTDNEFDDDYDDDFMDKIEKCENQVAVESKEANVRTRAPIFMDCTDTEKNDFVIEMRNKNTVRKTESVVKIFTDFLESFPRMEHRQIEDIPPTSLNNYVGSFILALRKHDGSEYEPDTLTSYHRAIERHLRQKNYAYSRTFDREFQTSRDILSSKRKELKQQGKGNRPNKAQPLTEHEEEVLKERKVIGTHSPQALVNKLWLSNSLHFGLRGGEENRKLRWGDVLLKRDERDVEFLEYNERDTKTRSGEKSNSHVRSFQPKQFAVNEDKENCPVEAYKAYRDHRPVKMCTPDRPFYLGINHKRKASSSVWYKCQAMGENTINNLMKNMAKKSNLPGRLTNHSARKTTCTRLLHAGVAPTTIMQLTGHNNVASINNYAVASHNMQEQMSRIISNVREAQPSTSAVALSPQPSTSRQIEHSTNSVNLHSSSNDVLSAADVFNLPPNTPNLTSQVNRATRTSAGVFQGASFTNCTFNLNFGNLN